MLHAGLQHDRLVCPQSRAAFSCWKHRFAGGITSLALEEETEESMLSHECQLLVADRLHLVGCEMTVNV